MKVGDKVVTPFGTGFIDRLSVLYGGCVVVLDGHPSDEAPFVAFEHLTVVS